ncbi:hypothetical protein ACIA5D_19135 [Actinoplanes sp. NPDC051513]|uniref:hypothetical protein n=1 Tax=Actinoplanes sp. NPDC051513 TaxID=3363908 RepID=UPI0037B5EEE0
MTGIPPTAADRLATALTELRRAAGNLSFSTLVRQAAAQRPPLTITPQRLSDWFGGKAVPADPAAVRFLVEHLQPRASRSGSYQLRPLSWWLNLRQEAVRQRRRATDPSPSRRRPDRLGQPIGDCDPLALEVHRAIDLPSRSEAAPVLPPYMTRAHDKRLRDVVAAVAGGASRMMMLVGGSSTGKTRACWEAIRPLAPRWWLWHPIDPTRPAAAVQGLAEVGPYTVVWLNEAQHYLHPPDAAVGERIAAGLRTLLSDPARGPILVIGTIWPHYWAALTGPPAPGGPDPHAQARELLSGTEIPVPDAFTGPDLQALRAAASSDARLRHATRHAEAGRITQQLAGVPGLLRRYLNGATVARAVIHAAMDVRRLGHPLPIPWAFLRRAVPGYLDDATWSTIGKTWPCALDDALADLGTPVHGILGPVTPIHPRPDDQPSPHPHFRLADYLEQTGRTERADVFPPAGFWNAAAAVVTDPAVLSTLGTEAHRRGRYRRAAQFYRQAADRGDTDALWDLAELRERAGDLSGAADAYRQAADRGDEAAFTNLARLRGAAADPGHIEALRDLARRKAQAGDLTGAETLYRQAADHGDLDALPALAQMRFMLDDEAGARVLLDEAMRTVGAAIRSLTKRGNQQVFKLGYQEDRNDTGALMTQAEEREEAGDLSGAEARYRQALNRGHIDAVGYLVTLRQKAGDATGAEQIRKFGLADDGSPATSLEGWSATRSQAS